MRVAVAMLARDDSIWQRVPRTRTGFDDAVRAALAATASA
jgi:hypothetical protein